MTMAEGFLRSPNLKSPNLKPKEKSKKKKSGDPPIKLSELDTSGRLPSGESFEDYQGLKKILVTSQRERVIRTIVKRTMSYALCRKLQIYDRPTVDAITKKLNENNGTFHDLVYEIANSLPFRETVLKTK